MNLNIVLVFYPKKGRIEKYIVHRRKQKHKIFYSLFETLTEEFSRKNNSKNFLPQKQKTKKINRVFVKTIEQLQSRKMRLNTPIISGKLPNKKAKKIYFQQREKRFPVGVFFCFFLSNNTNLFHFLPSSMVLRKMRNREQSRKMREKIRQEITTQNEKRRKKKKKEKNKEQKTTE